MIKQINGVMPSHNVAPEAERLPAGCYVCRVMSVKTEKFGDRDAVSLAFDVAEGPHAGYYTKRFEADKARFADAKYKGVYRMFIPTGDGSEKDGWTINRFNKDLGAFEDSNAGYKWTWDEMSLKGKTVGVVMRDREWEYNGNTGTMTEAAFLCTAESARANVWKAKPKTLAKKPASVASGGFFETSEDVPF